MITIIKNEDISTGLRDLILIGARQLAIFAYVLLLERTSLPAYSWVLVNMRSIILKRKLIKAKQRIGGREAVRNH
jgi:hypothetical protein